MAGKAKSTEECNEKSSQLRLLMNQMWRKLLNEIVENNQEYY